MPGHIYPTEKEKLLKSLSNKQLDTLQKDNPFKRERNALISELYRRGVSPTVLSKITGLSTSATHIIGSSGIKNMQKQGVDMQKLRESLKTLHDEISKILDSEGGEKGEFKQR